MYNIKRKEYSEITENLESIESFLLIDYLKSTMSDKANNEHEKLITLMKNKLIQIYCCMHLIQNVSKNRVFSNWG